MLEYWNNGLKTYNFNVGINTCGIDFDDFSMNILIGSMENFSFMDYDIFQQDEIKTQHSNIPAFQLRSEVELSLKCI